MMRDFHQRRLHVRVDLAQAAGGLHGQRQVGTRARAAGALFVSNITLGLLALQLALGARARRRLGAAPVALSLLAQRGAVGLRSNARRPALGRRANSLTLGALVLLTHVLRATDRALRLLAVHRALGAGRLLALHLTLGARAHRVALGRAHGVVALPTAFRVALSSHGLAHGRSADG